MDDQKDNQIQTPSALGISPLPTGQASLAGGEKNMDIYGFINKKTEKLITALYMVTDCIDFDDALKTKLRFLGVELLSDICRFSRFSIVDKYTHINTSVLKINEIISFIDIASTIGFISDMNAGILKREFKGLISELEAHLPKRQQFSFVLNEEMFNLPRPDNSTTLRPLEETKKTNYNGHSIRQDKGQSNGQKDKMGGGEFKKERTNKIIFLMKVKGEVSIKDVSSTFTECSEKTIQRDLNELISMGQVKKTGAKRWSRYKLVASS